MDGSGGIIGERESVWTRKQPDQENKRSLKEGVSNELGTNGSGSKKATVVRPFDGAAVNTSLE
jgi:hypothetical protein